MHRAEAFVPAALDSQEPSPEESLLERFVEQGDEAAFAGLVQRYGPQIFGLCRRVLHHQQDAEDAFQATFLVLARKAGSISKRESVGSWLYAVAYRIARQAKARRARLPVNESTPLDVSVVDGIPQLLWRDLRPILDEEVSRLPPKYREPFLLCYFEEKTNEEAAAQLGCPLGTIVSRLSRARDRLRARLKRRGITLSACLIATVLAERNGSAAVSAMVAQATVKAALLFCGGKPFAGAAIPTNVIALAEGYLRALRRVKVNRALARVFAAIAAVAAIILVILSLGGRQPNQAQPQAPVAPPVAVADDQQQIQGNWGAARAGVGGKIQRDFGSKLHFKNNQFQLDCKLFGPDEEFHPVASFKLNPAASPKQIDFIGENGLLWPGIYELDQNDLKICFNFGGPQRPTTFNVPPPGKGTLFYYELRRD